MRLIHTTRLELREFFDTRVPRYVILSHTWGDDEVSHHDFLRGDKTGSEGWKKIADCCQLARDYELEWAWVDTCCIDKTSSAELSEAINSTQQIAEITGIGVKYLRRSIKVREACVAERMFWAARRETTRVEDRAYRLLGLFDVHMPLLYGEREEAFTRLQREIIARSNDETIFAWTGRYRSNSGMLAPTVGSFANSGGLRRVVKLPQRPPSTSTHQGIEIAVTKFCSRAMVDFSGSSPRTHLEVPLACEIAAGPLAGQRLAIILARRYGDWLWHREVLPQHYTKTSTTILLLHEIEAIIVGYQRINISLQASEKHISFEHWAAYQRYKLPVQSFWNESLHFVHLICCLWLIPMDINYTQRYQERMGTSAALFQCVVLMWYWRLWSQNIPSVLLLAFPVAYAGLRHALVLIAYLLAAMLAHVTGSTGADGPAVVSLA